MRNIPKISNYRASMSFFSKRLSEITINDLHELIESEIRESIILDYKSEIYGKTDKDKKEFLYDVASFANSRGGRIVIGVREKKDEKGQNTGIPAEICGVDVPNEDVFLRQMTDLLLANIEERISNIESRVLDVEQNKQVVLIEVPQSVSAPHMVTYDGTNKFYCRHETRKALMDIREIQDAFERSRELMEKAKELILERMNELRAKVGQDHCIYYSALPLLRDDFLVNIKEPKVHTLLDAFDLFAGEYFSGGEGRDIKYHFWGLERFSSRKPPVGLYRDGYIQTWLLCGNGKKLIYPKEFEKRLYNFLALAIKTYDELKIQPPLVWHSAILNAEGYKLCLPNDLDAHEINKPLGNKELVFPMGVVHSFSETIDAMIRPVCDMLYNAFGFHGSRSFDSAGKFVKENPQ